MFRRLLIVVAMLVVPPVADAQSQSLTDPSGQTPPLRGVDDETHSGVEPMAEPPSLPGIPPAMPGIYSEKPPPGLPRASAPTVSPGQFGPPPNPGPVTGYGAGGLAPLPGAPANPPYSFGPLR